MTPKEVFRTNVAGFDLVIEEIRKNRYNVHYGKQSTKGLNWEEAAKEFGYNLFHALECDGKIDRG